jgi:hypothetical protein
MLTRPPDFGAAWRLRRKASPPSGDLNTRTFLGNLRTDPMKRMLVAEDQEITGADFDLQEILFVASELKDFRRGREWFRVAIERIRNNSHGLRFDLIGGVAPCRVSKTERGHASQQSIPARPVGYEKSQSALVRRLVSARDDPAKRRVHRWLSDISDDRLLSFGLTAQDIGILRGPPTAPS